MVFYFTIRGGPCRNANSHILLSSSDIICYVGKDKHENEFLIKYGWPGDIWFHVDSLSSAHVYFRVQTIGTSSNGANIPLSGIPIDDLPEDSVYDMMQIVKHNSISGSKLASTKIVYTPHSNLKKTFEMESGAVTYHNRALCRYARCDKDRTRVKELEKTKTERVGVDFYAEFKGNERRLIEYKKQERNRQRLGIDNNDYAGGGGSEGVELYDPIKDDVNTMRIRETRQGDDETGVDKALQALESLVFAPAPKANTPRTTTSNNAPADNGEDIVDHSPVWVLEAKARLIDTSAEVKFLCERGYTREEATEALQQSGGSRMVALKTLWQQPHNTHSSDETIDSDTAVDDAPTARLEEKEMLLAIFGEDEGVVFNDDENIFDCVLPIASYEPPNRYSCPPPLLLEVYVDKGMAPHYPASSPPVLALVGGGLPEALLAKLTTRLSNEALERCTQEPGDPQVFSLVNFLAEAVVSVIEEETVALVAEAQAAKMLRQQEAAERAKVERELAQQNPSEDQSSSSSDHNTSHTLVFKSEQERREYAKKIMSNVGLQEPSKNAKQAAEDRLKYRNTGVSDKSLIQDMFG